MDKAYLPQWGQLPVEQYLIKHWDHSSSEPTGDQRLRLIHQFLDLDEIPKELDPNCHASDTYEALSHFPTAYEIDTILRSWRSDNLRKIAWRIWGCDNDQLILLRTYYNADDNDKITELVGSDELHEENVAWWALLDNPELFNFGDQWWRVFDILPELAGPLNDYSRLPNPENISRERQYFKNTILPTLKQSDEWRANRDNYIERQSDFLRRTASKGYLAIADQEAFETDMLRLIYHDGKRNIVQETRMAFDEQTFADVAVEWDQLSLPVELWDNGMTGEKYRHGHVESGEQQEEIEEQRKRDLILSIIGGIRFVVPFVGEAGALVAGATTLARVAAIAGEAANTAFSIYTIVEDPDSALLSLMGMLVGAGGGAAAFRDVASFNKMAKVRKSMTAGEVAQFGDLFKKNDDLLQSIIAKCSV